MDFTRPLWVGHFGLCFTCDNTGMNGHKRQYKNSQLIIGPTDFKVRFNHRNISIQLILD